MSNKCICIKNLDARVTEEELRNIFSLISPIAHVKITEDNSNNNLHCGFVEFFERQAAEQALNAMDKRTIYSQEIAVSWNISELSKGNDNLQIIVSNLDPNTTDDTLSNAFKRFSISDAHVIHEGEGIVTCTDKEKVEETIRAMDGEMILSKRIHCECALGNNDEVNVCTTHSRRSSVDNEGNIANSNMSYEEIFAQTPLYNTSVCIYNLPKNIISQDIAPYLQQHGYVSDIYIKPNKGKAIAKLDTHANAATAIFALQGVTIAGKTVRLDWVKDRNNVRRTDSVENMGRSFNVFSSGYVPPCKLVNQITKSYENHATMRPPAPTINIPGSKPEGGPHGWNQYYEQYYSAGHVTI